MISLNSFPFVIYIFLKVSYQVSGLSLTDSINFITYGVYSNAFYRSSPNM